MKYLTRSEAAQKKDQAAMFMRRLGQADRASEYESMSVGEYAAERGAQLLENPNRRRKAMARVTKGELNETLEEIADLAEEALDPELTREEVVAKVKELADLASGEEEEAEDEDLEGSDDLGED